MSARLEYKLTATGVVEVDHTSESLQHGLSSILKMLVGNQLSIIENSEFELEVEVVTSGEDTSEHGTV